MNKFKHLPILLALLCLIGVMLPTPLRAQDAGSKAGQMWKDAQGAFGRSDYPQAATSLEAIIRLSATTAHWLDTTTIPPAPPKQQWMEPVFFMLGAARFDAKDWPNAISVFDKYLQLFPKAARVKQVRFSLAQANLLGGHPDAAIPLLVSLLPIPDYHQKVFLLLLEAYKSANKPDDAIALIEREKTQPNLDPDFLEAINTRLFSLYLDGGSEMKAVPLLHEMDADILHVPDVTVFNRLAVRLGDLFLPQNDIVSALDCYRRVRDNDQIIALQKLQIENLQRQMTANLVLIRADPVGSTDIQLDNKDIEIRIAKDRDILAQYQTLPPVQPPLLLRIGRAYSSARQFWEAAVVYHELLRRYPNCQEAEAALYGSVVVFDQLKQTARGQALCEGYLAKYPNGKYADSVNYLHGILAFDAQDYDKAIALFSDTLKNQPNNPRREQIELILGDIKLQQQKFDDAIASYQQYEKDFPQGEYLEKAEYRSALALVYAGKSDDATKAILAYIQKYPQGDYVADGEYRLALVKFAAKQYDQVIADCLAWQKKHGKVGPLAEVLSLEGDCYASLDRNDEAVDAYTQSYKAALTPDVLNYAIFAAAKILQQQSKWTDVVTMFQNFVKDNPDHPTVISAISWIGRADIKLGKVDEAKQFLADTAKQYLNDPSRSGVDEIITQLAQLYAHKHLNPAPPPIVAAGTANQATPSPSRPSPITVPSSNSVVGTGFVPPESSPQSPPPDPNKELEDILNIPNLDTQPTAQARILYAQAELARLQRKPKVEAQFLLQIATFKPEDLSPILLGQVGDRLVQGGQPAQAVPFYNHLMDDFDKSPVVDYAYNGLARVAYDQKDFKTAERYYSQALNKGVGAAKLKDITLGEALSLLALNRPEEARPFFEDVASTRAWRGEATALSVYSLGEIQMAEGKFAEANAYYQRVFVAYQKYPAIQAKAYLKSGEAFEKLGKIPEAINTYSEMVKNPKLASFPETSEAQQRLQHLQQLAQK